MEIANAKILISGGTSGLGLALAAELTHRGGRVATFARHVRPVPKGVHFFPGDIADKDQIYPIAGQTLAALGGLDILINNASALGPTPLPLLLDANCEDFEAVWRANVLGPFRLIKALTPNLLAQRRGLILNISSDAAVNGYPGWGLYGSSKAALDQLTRVLDAELAPFGVRALAVDPGDMDTPMYTAAASSATAISGAAASSATAISGAAALAATAISGPAVSSVRRDDLKDPAVAARQLADLIGLAAHATERRVRL